MNRLNRRQFLHGSLAAGAVLAMPSSRILGANNDIRLGVIGVGSHVKIGGMGRNEIAAYLKIPGMRFVALCDCDKANLVPEVEKLRSHNLNIKAYTDLRELLDDTNVDAVIVTTPNSQIIFLDYDPAPILFEVRGLPKSKTQRKDTWRASDMDEYHGMQIATILRCENGYVANRSAGGTAAYDNNDKLIQKFEPASPDLRVNFLNAIRSRRAEDLVCPVLQGHYSASLVHMGNLSYRLGKEMPREEIRETVKSEKTVAEALDRFLTHLDANEIDLKKTPIRMGPMLTMDPQTERFTGPFSDTANMFLSRNYREPFVVPERV